MIWDVNVWTTLFTVVPCHYFSLISVRLESVPLNFFVILFLIALLYFVPLQYTFLEKIVCQQANIFTDFMRIQLSVEANFRKKICDLNARSIFESPICKFPIQAFLGFDFRNFTAVYSSNQFSSPLVLLSNYNLNGFCFHVFLYVSPH